MPRALQYVPPLLLVGLLAACGEASPSAPVEPEPPPTANPAITLQAISCVASVREREVRCGPPSGTESSASPRGASSKLIVGGVGRYIELLTSNVHLDGATNEFSLDVAVKNLIPQSLGTADDISAAPGGVRLFFADAPVAIALTDKDGPSGVTIRSPDGFAAFTQSNQPYYEYSGARLGADGVLSTNETSAPKEWAFHTDPNVEGFLFLVYVSASVPHPNGFVEVTSDLPFALVGATRQLTGVVRSAVGDAIEGDELSWSSGDTAVATVDPATGLVTGVAPGVASIKATNGSNADSMFVSVCPDLSVGEGYSTTGSAAASTCIAGASGAAAEYVAIPFNGSAGSLSLTALATGIQSVTGPPSPYMASPTPGVSLLHAATSPAPLVTTLANASPMMSDVAMLQNEGGRPRGRSGAPLPGTAALVTRPAAGGTSRLIGNGVPSVGTYFDLNVTRGCTGTASMRRGRVASVGTHAIIVADSINPSGGLSTAQYDSIAAELDTLIYTAVTGSFGEPSDVDGNGRVVVFYTSAVNELSQPAVPLFAPAGYVEYRDLFAAAQEGCPLSNQGEIIYMAVPDPTGAVNGNVRTASFVRSTGRAALAHQLQHLINASRRVYVVSAYAFEEPWLDEGLSRIAEELVFYDASVGLSPGGNIALATLTTGASASRRVAAFNTYANGNFQRLRSWLQRPDTTGVYRAAFVEGSWDGGGISNDASQGAVWAFLRYAADHYDGAQSDFWRALTDSRLEGWANFEAATGRAHDAMVRDFITAMYADDNAFSVAPEHTQPSWNFRSVYGGLGGYPLGTRPLTNGAGLTLSYASSASAWMRFGVPAGGFATLKLDKVGGGSLPSATAMTILRTK